MEWEHPTLAVQVLRCCRNTVWPWPQSPLLAVAVVITAPLSHAYPPHVRKSRSSRVRQTKFYEKRLRRKNPVATCGANLARQKHKCTHGSDNCALHTSCVLFNLHSIC